MDSIGFEDLPEQALVLLDSAPVIYVLENHVRLAARFRPLFEAHERGRLRFSVTTITIAEVLIGPLQAGDEALARRYRAMLERWQPVALDVRHRGKRHETARFPEPEAGGCYSSGKRARD